MAAKPPQAHLPDVHLEPYGNLWLDPDNPRLAELNLKINEQDRILQWLWKNKDVSELVDSMLAGGYWPHEELFVSKESGKLVVIEGNRRLAAVRLLLEPDTRERLNIKADWDPSTKVLDSLRELPVILRPRKDIMGLHRIQTSQWSATVGFHCEGSVHPSGPLQFRCAVGADRIYSRGS
jgi:hypothetical protein